MAVGPKKAPDLWSIGNDAQSHLKNEQYPELAALIRAHPAILERVQGNIDGADLIPILGELKTAPSSLRLEVVRLVMEERKFGDHQLLSAVKAALTPEEQRALIELVSPSVGRKLLAASFARPQSAVLPEVQRIDARDLVRLMGPKMRATPELESLLQSDDFAARLSAIERGKAAFVVEERAVIASRLRGLDDASLSGLVKVLQRTASAHLPKGFAKGRKPGVALAMSILSGEAFGARPESSAALAAQAKKELGRWELVGDETSEGWIEHLSQSESAIALLDRMMARGLPLLRVFSLSEIDALDLGLDRPSFEGYPRKTRCGAFRDALPYKDAGAKSAKAYHDRVGPKAFERAIDLLSAVEEPPRSAPWDLSAVGFNASWATEVLGFGGAVQLAEAVQEDPFGARACIALRSEGTVERSNALYEAVEGKSAAGIRALFARAKTEIAGFSSGGVALRTWSAWPKRVANAAVRPAERALLERAGLSSDLLRAPRDAISTVDAANLVNAMKAELIERSPERAAELERELLGRQFISHARYTALYDSGARSPELAYFQETYDSWKEAKAMLASAKESSRGRPLAPGELIALIKQTHRLAAEGMLKKEALSEGTAGVFRHEITKRDLPMLFDGDSFASSTGRVFVGGGMISEGDLERLRANPIVRVHTKPAPDGGTHLLGVELATVDRIEALVGELDAWVREHEGRIPPEALAAEVHHRLVSIHPFLDGNGRVAKLIANFLLDRAGVPAAIWRSGDVLVHHDTWPSVVADGVRFHLEITERHWRAALAKASG